LQLLDISSGLRKERGEGKKGGESGKKVIIPALRLQAPLILRPRCDTHLQLFLFQKREKKKREKEGGGEELLEKVV